MRKLSIILTAVLLLLGLVSCECDPVKPTVELGVKTSTLTIEKGKTAQIDYTVTPTNTPVTFKSDKADIASVDDKGLVTALAAGTATITLTASEKQATVAVTVTDNSGGGGGGTTSTNELPVLKFDPTYNNGVINDPIILDHEKKVGRKPHKIMVGHSGPFNGFANTDLTITGVVYGFFFAKTKENTINAFSKETLANCPKTTAMLAEYGFTKLKDSHLNNGTPCKIATIQEGSAIITMEMYDQPNEELQSKMRIIFIWKKDIEVDHPIIPNVRDFPSYTALITEDASKIKAFEAGLGFRTYIPSKSDEARKNLFFVTAEDKKDDTNFSEVFYVVSPSAGKMFIGGKMNCIRNVDDLADPYLEQWFKVNGFGKDFRAEPEQAYVAGYDPTGKIYCQIVVYRGIAARFQIWHDDNP